jgi:hypothetical protein
MPGTVFEIAASLVLAFEKRGNGLYIIRHDESLTPVRTFQAYRPVFRFTAQYIESVYQICRVQNP